MNQFGGNWTEAKIEILIEYTQAYLSIMNIYASRCNWKLLYFDSFAGSGSISKKVGNQEKTIIGAARRILEIKEPRIFDQYYFVEKDTRHAAELKQMITNHFPNTLCHVESSDCNQKIVDMINFLKSEKGVNYKVLAFIDPYGMQLNWQTLLKMKQSDSIDAWILVPTGMGVNRLLTKNADIKNDWVERLMKFLGLTEKEIRNYFYTTTTQHTLFGEEVVTSKQEKAIERAASLYKQRLGEIFRHVTEPYIMKNSSNSILFHFFMVSNNKTGVKIANDIIKKYNK